VQVQASPDSPSVTGEVDRGTTQDGVPAWARIGAHEGAKCSAVTLEKAATGAPCDGEGEWRCFFLRGHEALKRVERSGASGVQADGRPLPSISEIKMVSYANI
jgi:hypothetical protein